MKILVLGYGKMGKWLVDVLSKEQEVMVYDPLLSLELLPPLAIKSTEQIENFNPDMLLNCVNLQNTCLAFEDILPLVRKDCLLVDITSVKGDLHNFYQKLPNPFVSIHPMFGPTFANLEQLSGQNVVLVSESHPEGLAFFNNLFDELGLRITKLSFEEHDSTMAYSLSIPFISTMVFAACLKEQTAPGTTFMKQMQVAKGLLGEDDYLIGEILFNSHTLPRLNQIGQELAYLGHILKQRDFEELQKFMNNLRGNLLKFKQ